MCEALPIVFFNLDLSVIRHSEELHTFGSCEEFRLVSEATNRDKFDMFRVVVASSLRLDSDLFQSASFSGITEK